MAPLTIACVKAKPNYTHEYVNKLYKAVRNHISIPYRFICFTDDSTGLKCRSKPLPKHLLGWWAKLSLFREHLFDGKVLYLDLDTLITGDLDFVGSYDGDFAILRDFYRPEGYGSGVMLWNKPQPQVWNNWVLQGLPDDELGDQGWMEKQVKHADRLQDLYPGKFVSYKADCENGLPKGAAVCCFHGEPKPHQIKGWAREIWDE